MHKWSFKYDMRWTDRTPFPHHLWSLSNATGKFFQADLTQLIYLYTQEHQFHPLMELKHQEIGWNFNFSMTQKPPNLSLKIIYLLVKDIL